MQPRAGRFRRLVRGLALALALPLAISFGLILLVTRSYMACTGSEVVATGKRVSQLLWLFGLPLLTYTAVALSFVRWRSMTVTAHALRTLGASGAVGLLYVYLNARYFTLTQEACADGLPLWWPDWVPIR
jgi:hypothetical protein